MLHDENVYPDPSTFRPERFLTEDGKLNADIQDPTTIVFGFGRRCDADNHTSVLVLITFHSVQGMPRQSHRIVRSLANGGYGTFYHENH